MIERRNVLEIMIGAYELLRRSQTRINLLFTMSEIPQAKSVKTWLAKRCFADDILWVNSQPVLSQPVYALRAAPGTLRSPCPAAPRIAEGEAWWSQTGSNRRPHACKARALPAELWPRTRRRMLRTQSKWWAWEDLNFRPHAYQARALTN